jgi:hypothetical protein
MSPTADWTDRFTMADYQAELEHAAVLHYEDAYDAAMAVAEIELRTGTRLPRLVGAHDGCLLPARSYRFFATAPDGMSVVQIAVTPVAGGAFHTTVTTRAMVIGGTIWRPTHE